MEPNPVIESIGKMLTGQANFFWDAFAALQVNGISGDYAEFGCHHGGSFQAAYKAMAGRAVRRHMWAFDSWRELPEDDARDRHPGWELGGANAGGIQTFHASLRRHGVPRDAYTAVEGYYRETLPPLRDRGAPTDIALAYVDCDLYSSTVDVLEFIAPRLKHGMIVAFDDYFCWSPTDLSGERAAMLEFLAAHPEWNFQRYKDIHWAGLSFVVERSDSLPPGRAKHA
jgi:O-methyltransferase